MSSIEYPKDIITDVQTKTVTLTPEIAASLPDIDRAFAEADQVFLKNPAEYLRNLQASMFKFCSSEGPDVACSLLYDSSSQADELLVIFAPFADRDPKSSAAKLYEYMIAETPGGIISKEKFAPNSWNQTTKSAVIFELLGALGKDIPVLTIYNPVPTHAYSFKEKSRLRKGDFSPAGRLVKEAISQVQDLLHGPSAETRISRLHLGGASLGASNAIGASASKELGQSFVIPTVTAQELIMGPVNVSDLGNRFMFSQYVGYPSDERLSQRNPKIAEPAIRRAIDKYGSEPLGTTARTIKAMKPTYMFGLTRPDTTVQAVERLLDNNISLLVALAENSSLTAQTPKYLPGDKEKLIRIRGETGQKIGHLADEHVALTGIIAALGIKNR